MCDAGDGDGEGVRGIEVAAGAQLFGMETAGVAFVERSDVGVEVAGVSQFLALLFSGHQRQKGFPSMFIEHLPPHFPLVLQVRFGNGGLHVRRNGDD